MILSQTNCKQIFREAYENRYTWPAIFNGYEGKCIFITNDKKENGDFIVGKDFKPTVRNISNENVEKAIKSQLFEVVIHRLKRSFDEAHSKNNFQLETNTKEGIKMIVSGKNEGDKYRVKDKSINMVYRKMHGIVIEIFVEKFIDTNKGLLSQKYTSIQLDQQTLKPISQKLYYEDEFISIGTDFWVLSSRKINYVTQSHEKKEDIYLFKEMSLLS